MSNAEPKGFNPSDHLIKVQGNRAYLPVSAAIAWFRTEHPDWSIICEVTVDGDSCLAAATVMSETGTVVATAHKQETRQSFADYVEKAESGAVGRALRFAGYGTADVDVDNQMLDSARITTDTSTITTNRPIPTAETCVVCGVALTSGQAALSGKRYGKVLCSEHQKAAK